MSRVGDLSDGCFSTATRLIAELCAEFEEEIEDKPTIAELCEILEWGIRSCSRDILKDINVENIVGLKANVSKRRKITLTPGDVIAIPTADGDRSDAVFLTVYLGRFRIAGDAMGLLAGRHPNRKSVVGVKPIPIAHPVFSIGSALRRDGGALWVIAPNGLPCSPSVRILLRQRLLPSR